MVESLWSAYVARLLNDSGVTEAAFVRERSVQQGTFNRWKNGASVPDKAAIVAEFAQECGRNVVEAFVAAGMLTLEEAGGAIDEESVLLLEELGKIDHPSAPTVVVGSSVPKGRRLLALIDEYQAANAQASDAWIANQINISAGDIKSWRKHGLTKYPSEKAMLALASVLGKHDNEILYAVGVDVGQIIEVEDEGPDSLPTTG